MAAAVVMVKVLGALYKIPLTNILGPDGMGYFTTAYNIYNVLLTISTAGLPVALSKMVAEANTLGLHNQKRRTFHVAFLTFFILGTAGTLVMACFPRQLAEMMNNAQAWYAIIALSPAVVGVCCMSAFRGYTQGHTNMVPTAVSQVIEAICKLVLGLIIAVGMLGRGYNTAEAAGGTILGISIGSILGLLYLTAHHFIHRKQYQAPSMDSPPARPVILKRILQLGIPIMLGSSVLSIITLVDAKLIYFRLQTSAGFTEEAANWIYGVYSSTMTLYNLPAALIVPLTTSVIPALSAYIASRNSGGILRIVNTSSRITALFALPAGIGLTVLAGPILKLLYPMQPEIADAGAPLLMVLGISSIFVCTMLLTNSFLQAFGKVNIPVYTMLVGGVVKIAANWFLVGHPDINIHGAPVGTMLCFIVIVAVNFIVIFRMLPQRMKLMNTFGKPLIASLIMGAAAWAFYGLLYRGAGILIGVERAGMVNAVAAVGAIVIGVVLYLILVLRLHIISREDLSLMPKGEKLAKILRLK